MNANQVKTIFEAANSAYIKRAGSAAVVGKNGFQADIEKGMNTVLAFTPAQFELAAKLGVNWETVGEYIAQSTNVKKAARLPQFIGFVISGGDARYLQGSAKTALVAFCALMIGAKNKNGLQFVATGKGNESTSDSVSVSKARAVQQAVGKIESGSYDTQISVAFSKGGILPALGCCEAWSGKGELVALPELNKTKFNAVLIKLVETTSESTIQMWGKKKAQ